MNKTLLEMIEKFELLDAQTFQNLTIFPFIYKNGFSLKYIALDEAQAKKQIIITEVSESGSVPELYVENLSDERVLLLDGEELIGAKQNRILNTTILIEKKTKLRIPVSCVEAGRWGYTRRDFTSSPRVVSPSLKLSKNLSVSDSLRASEGKSYRSDQGRVWNEVERIRVSSKTTSPTSSLSDSFDQRSNDIEKFVEAFKIKENQNGMVVLINGTPISLDFVSDRQVFQKLFKKLIRGYSMDALIEFKKFKVDKPKDLAVEFIRKIANCKEEVFKSVGLGNDHRLTSEDLVGVSLSVDDEIVYLNAIKIINYDDKSYIRRRFY